MFTKKLELVWSDGSVIAIDLSDNPVAEWYARCVKRLQHVPLQFNQRSNPLSQSSNNVTLLDSAQVLGLDIDLDSLGDQAYLNHLHDIYLSRYQRDPRSQWLDFHDALHAIEDAIKQDRYTLWLDHGDRAGPLIKPFDRDLLSHATTQLIRGDCVIMAHELGKTFWHYWRDGEPRDDIKRICTMVPPWRFLKPVLDICYRDRSHPYGHTELDGEFARWLERLQEPWSQHWGIENWNLNEPDQVLPVGSVRDIDACVDRFARSDCPVKIRLPV